MESIRSGLVDIVREYLLAHQLTREVAARFRAGELRFEEVVVLIGDDEGACLFRLKERCHALFRPEGDGATIHMRREALFDLAVGALFHESMKFRENLYQREVYGPKVRALRSQSGPEAQSLFAEFEKILAASLMRVEEALQEVEALLEQTREQFRALLQAHRSVGVVTRFLCAHADPVAQVFPDGLDALLAEIHGDAATGYAVAARSALDSGFYEEGRRSLDLALAHDGTRDTLHRLVAYAEGMGAYLGGRYGEAVDWVGRWLDAGPEPDELDHARLAWAAVSSVGQLVEGDAGRALAERAEALAERIQTRLPGAAG